MYALCWLHYSARDIANLALSWKLLNLRQYDCLRPANSPEENRTTARHAVTRNRNIWGWRGELTDQTDQDFMYNRRPRSLINSLKTISPCFHSVYVSSMSHLCHCSTHRHVFLWCMSHLCLMYVSSMLLFHPSPCFPLVYVSSMSHLCYCSIHRHVFLLCVSHVCLMYVSSLSQLCHCSTHRHRFILCMSHLLYVTGFLYVVILTFLLSSHEMQVFKDVWIAT